ncbi:MAG TPA: IPT/TIG domain-containing protein [Candidatus Sulfotelmatobacter sp.]|nr:IPT/TIG domain-containing protein [Candidatus Sulfotelmatobacter sp.]
MTMAPRRLTKYPTLALLLAAALLTLGLLLFAQGAPVVTAVDPSSGKVNDTVTVAGENLGKDTVSAVFLSDDKTDYKATLIEQNAEKIVMKVPQVKPSRYNISIQKGNAIYIQPVRFTVQE